VSHEHQREQLIGKRFPTLSRVLAIAVFYVTLTLAVTFVLPPLFHRFVSPIVRLLRRSLRGKRSVSSGW